MNEYVKHAQDAIATDLPPIKEYQGGNIYQVTAFSNEKESQLIMNRLNNCKLTRWNPYGVDIISNTGGKINWYQRYPFLLQYQAGRNNGIW